MRGALLTVALLLLAGCSGSDGPDVSVQGKRQLAPNAGGIDGLLIDDIYRPIPQATVLLLPLGLTTTTDQSGQFVFVDLVPGSYTLKVDSVGHEGAPITVDVAANEFTETEFPARRIANDDGRIISTYFSVFVPCAYSTPDGTSTLDCTFDQSDETARIGFTTDYTSYGENVTYVVTEMKSSKPADPAKGAYKVVVRDSRGGDPYFASGFITDTDYLRLTMKYGTISPDDAEPGRNKNWTNQIPLQTAFFPQGGFKKETQQAIDAQCGVSGLCFESRGLGVQMGVKATFLQSAFIGEPLEPIEEYRKLG